MAKFFADDMVHTIALADSLLHKIPYQDKFRGDFFFYSKAFRNAVSLGGDSDTQACIVEGIAKAYYGGLPQAIVHGPLSNLNQSLQ